MGLLGLGKSSIRQEYPVDTLGSKIGYWVRVKKEGMTDKRILRGF